MIETQVQDRIVARLMKLGIWAYRVRAEAKFRGAPAVPPGTFDIDIPALGRMECKMRGEKLSPKQIEYGHMCDLHGVRNCVVYEVQAGPEEMISRAVHIALEWRKDEARRHRQCPMGRCPLEDHAS